MNETTTTATVNVTTHTNTVHKVHTKRLQGMKVPACMTFSQVRNLHYTVETDAAVTCTKPACNR